MWFSRHTQIHPLIKFQNASLSYPCKENASKKLWGPCSLLCYSAWSAETSPQWCWFNIVIPIFVWRRKPEEINGCMSTFKRERLDYCQPQWTYDVWFLSATHILFSAWWEVVWLPSCQNNHRLQFCSQWPKEPLKKSFISQHQVFKWCIYGSKSRKRFTLQKEMRLPPTNWNIVCKYNSAREAGY